MNLMYSTLFLCLHNPFLKKLTVQYFSVVVRAVPPEETGCGSFATMSSFLFHSCYLCQKRRLFEDYSPPQVFSLCTQHQWVMKSSPWKDEN
jgi:hypothetical protein